jgi:Integrase core domain.
MKLTKENLPTRQCLLYLEVMQRKIKEWEYVWNNIRPHQALNYLTPSEYLLKVQNGRIPTKDIITLQT